MCAGPPPTLDDSLKATHGSVMYYFSLCARSPVCFLDLDLQQEAKVWDFSEGTKENKGLQEIAMRYQRAIKKGIKGLLTES